MIRVLVWASLKPIDRIIIEHLAFAGVEDLFGAAFVAKANKALQPPSPLSAAKIQTAVKRLVKWDVLAPTGVEGVYEIEDRAFMLYVLQLRAGSASAQR